MHSRTGTRARGVANGLRLGKESDAEDEAIRRTCCLDVEDAATCERLVVVRTDRVGVEERNRRGGYRRGFRLLRFGDKRRCCGGVVAAGSGGDPGTGRYGARCDVTSRRTVVTRSRRAGAPQFTAKRPNGSPRQHRHDQQRRCAEHGPAPRGASTVPSPIRRNLGKLRDVWSASRKTAGNLPLP